MFCAYRSRIYNTDIKIFRKLKHNSRSQEISWPLRCSAVQCRAEQSRTEIEREPQQHRAVHSTSDDSRQWACDRECPYGYNNGVVCHFFSQLSDTNKYQKVEWFFARGEQQYKHTESNKKCINKLWSLSYHGFGFGFEFKVCIQLVQRGDFLFRKPMIIVPLRWFSMLKNTKQPTKNKNIQSILMLSTSSLDLLVCNAYNSKILLLSWFT